MRLIYGEEFCGSEGRRVAIVQGISGTGSLQIGAQFIKKFLPGRPVYVSKPTWVNHFGICQTNGLEVREYRYYDPNTINIDFDGFKADLNAAPEGSIILLHVSAHNPTGVDPTHEQWRELRDVFMQRRLIPFFDTAYQGFASGDPDYDAFSIRYFVSGGLPALCAQSYAKNMGLYSERIGSFSVVTENPTEASNVQSQLKIIIRTLYSNPPIYGARLVSKILSDPILKQEWFDNLKTMSGRIIRMRSLLRSSLEAKGTPGDWSHITRQIGMFSFLGITKEQAQRLVKEYHIYLLDSGRISMAGLNDRVLEYFANAVHEVVSNTGKL